MTTTSGTDVPITLAGSFIATLVGGGMLALRILDPAALHVMKADSAVAFLLTGVALSIGATTARPGARRFMQGLAALVAAMGAWNVLQNLVGWNFGIDQLLPWSVPDASIPRRMVPTTAGSFVLIGFALFREADARRDPTPAHALALAAAIAPSIALIHYAYESEPLYGVPSYTRMAVHTALTFWAVCSGILFLRPEKGFMAVVAGDSAGGVMVRRLLPVTIAFPVVLGWLRLAGERAGFFGSDSGVLLTVVCNVAVLTTVLVWTAASLHRTDRSLREALEALGASERRNRELTEGSLDAIVVADGEGRIVLFNPAAERAFGYSAAEVRGQPLTVLMPPEFHEQPEAGLRRFVETRGARLVGRTVEITGRHKDGTEFPVELSLAAVEVAGGLQFIGSMRDLTERHRMRAAMIQSEKLASIGLLSAGVAHEINNPLAYVANNLAVLTRETRNLMSVVDAYEADPAPPERVRKLAEEIDLPYLRANLDRILGSTREGVDRVTRIVQAMRGMARTGPLRMETVRVTDLVDMSLELMRGRIARRGITVEVSCGAAPEVRCAASQLGGVVLNLLVNAVQAVEAAGRQEGGAIRIGSRPVGREILIEVSDDGCGIAEKDLSQVFDPFFTTKDVGEGTGLGLAISHGIVTAHGGRMEVSSTPGRGSSFRVFLPLREGEPA